jgi:hypothetical protein
MCYEFGMRQKSVSAVNQAVLRLGRVIYNGRHGSFRSRLLRPDVGTTPRGAEETQADRASAEAVRR